jgi:hypothetical protein
MSGAIESHGGLIRLQSPVTKVIIDKGRVTGVEVNGQEETFDKVISTIPLPYVLQVIPDLPADVVTKLKALRNIAVVCVIVKLTKPLTGVFWLNINDPDMDIPGLVEYTNLHPLSNHILYVPFYMPGEHPKFADANEVFIKKVKCYLKKINPELSENDFLNICVNRYRYAQPICGPGYLEKLPPVELPVQGLWVADTSYYYPEDRGISESIKFGLKMAKAAVF